MANNKSSKKRIQIAKRNCIQNKYYKTSVRTLIKKFLEDLETYKTSQTPDSKVKLQETLNLVYSYLDKGTKTNVFHKNAAARQKAKLAQCLNNI